MATWDGNMDRHTISADLGFSARDLSDPSTDIALTSLSEDYKSQETQFKNTITTLGGYHTCLIKRTLLAADKPNHVKSPLYWDMWPIQSMRHNDRPLPTHAASPCRYLLALSAIQARHLASVGSSEDGESDLAWAQDDVEVYLTDLKRLKAKDVQEQ